MKPDKHKKKDFLKADRSDYDGMIGKDFKIHQIKDEDDLDELPSKGKNNRAFRGRYFSNAVDRFLRQKIGNKWDDVYSDLIKRVGHNDNTRWRVELNTFELDGKIVSNGYCGTQEVSGFYIHNGILQERKKGKRIRAVKTRVTFVDGFVVFKHNNLFFKAPIDKTVYDWWELDGNYAPYKRTSGYLKYSDSQNRRGVKKFIASRYIRQLNHKELIRWELPDTDINH